MTALALPVIAEAYPRAELLRDRLGVYGCALVTADDQHEGYLGWFVTRPDCLATIEERNRHRGDRPVLQPIPRLKFFRSSTENLIADGLFTALLALSGLTRYESAHGWWSDDPREQSKNRRRYHACKRKAVCITNNLVRQALAVAEPEALRAARRFSGSQRWRIYQATANSPRMLQLAKTFPLLLDLITSAHDELCDEATRLVEAGARLKTVADLMRVPMVFRGVEPGVTWLAREVLADRTRHSLFNTMAPLVAAFMPSGTRAQRRWFWALYQAASLEGPYVEWVARHALELGSRVEQVRAQVHDIGDWVAASYAADVPDHVRRAIMYAAGSAVWATPGTAAHVTRRFSRDMSVRTVRELSADWHEAVALSAPEISMTMPEPWREATTIATLEVVPLATAADIIAEGRAMHHCARAYIPKVARGECYLFSARQDGQRVATVEVQRFSGGVSIRQMRGPCNAILPKATQDLLKRWCQQRHAWADPAPDPEARLILLRPDAGMLPDFDDGIPF